MAMLQNMILYLFALLGLVSVGYAIYLRNNKGHIYGYPCFCQDCQSQSQSQLAVDIEGTQNGSPSQVINLFISFGILMLFAAIALYFSGWLKPVGSDIQQELREQLARLRRR